MLNYLIITMHRNLMLLVIALGLGLGIIGVYSSIRANDIVAKPIIIAIDDNGVRVVTRDDDPILKTEAVAFIKDFTHRIYTFNKDSFFLNIGIATGMMSDELWAKEKDKLLELYEKVKADDIELKSNLKSIELTDKGSYVAKIDLVQKSRLSEVASSLSLELFLIKRTRTLANPYALFVTNYVETPISK